MRMARIRLRQGFGGQVKSTGCQESESECENIRDAKILRFPILSCGHLTPRMNSLRRASAARAEFGRSKEIAR
jgi:hypothetical protein